MSNINVRVVGTANLTQMTGAFGKVEAQVAGLNAQLAQMVALQNGVDPRGYERMAQAAAQNSKNFRNAAASTGMFEVQQLKLNRAEDDYIKKLKARKLSFADIRREQATAAKAYQQQLQMENMLVRQTQSSTLHNKNLLDVTYSRQVSSELDTAGRRLAFFNEQLKSGAHQMVNWGKNTQWAGRQLMVGFTMPIAAFGAAAGVMAYQIDKEFTRVAKVYDTTATTGIAKEKELQAVREEGMKTAILSASEYGASAQDTINVQAELAATGQRGMELQKATAEVMRISRLGELEYQDAIKTTIALQSVFKQNTNELTESFNYMNSVENATSLATADFAAAIPIAAAPVKMFGGDIQELGVLLTAMKERGIEATQGANAIKAAMQRLGRPSAQIQEEWAALTNTDITQIFDDATSLTDLFTQIRHATEDLTDKERIKAFAGLFGSYQVTRMTALVEGMGDLENGIGQVSDAYKLAQGSASDWADTAQQEIERYQQSISGQWDTAIKELQIQMSTLGEPFIVVATKIVSGISMIIDWFNKLPDFAKIGIAGAVGLAAIAGPLVMLAGLFANLTGNILKGYAAFTGLFVKMNILDVESRAAAAAAKLVEAGFIDQRTAVQQLTAELIKYNDALAAANAMTAGRPAATAAGTATAAATAAPVMIGMPGGMVGEQPSKMYHGAKIVDQERLKTAQELAAAERERLHSQVALSVSAQEEADLKNKTALANEKSSRSAAGAVTSFAVMNAAMATMMLTSNETANSIAQMALIGSMVVPAAKMLVPPMVAAAKAAWAAAAGMAATARNAAGARVATLGLVGSARAAGAAFSAMMGPIGWITLAVSAIGFGVYKWQQRQKEIYEDQIRAQKAIDDGAKIWAEEMGKVAGKYETIATISNGLGTGKSTESQFTGDLEMYEHGALKDQRQAYEDIDPDEVEQRIATAKQMFVDLQVVAGMSARRATAMMTAFYVSVGKSMYEAREEAAKLFKEIGPLKTLDWAANLENQAELLRDAFATSNTEVAESAGKDYAEAFSMGFNRAEPGSDMMKSLIGSVQTQAMAPWEEAFKRMQTIPQAMTFLQEGQIDSAKELREYYRGIEEDSVAMLRLQNIGVQSLLGGAEAAEANFIKILADVNRWGDGVVFIEDVMSQIDITSRGLTYDEGLKAAKKWKNELLQVFQLQADAANMFGDDTVTADNLLRNRINALNVAHGYKEGSNAAEAMAFYVNQSRVNADKLKNSTDGARSAANALASAWASIGNTDIAGVAQSAMQGVQQDIADDISKSFDTQMNAALDTRQEMWDRRSDALNAELDRRQNALDAKWERRKDAAEEYWDNRIQKVEDAIAAEEKAEEKRQKMFDAEIERINALNEAMNQNIDFNVALTEGKFDEAAKIRNDVTAGDAQTALERAAEAGSNASAKRVDKLEGRRDAIEKAREKAMKALEKREEAERRHLEKISQMRQDALQQDMEADMEAQREMWESRKESLDEQLDLFLAYIARNEKDLKRHMDSVGLSYKKFGDDVLMPMGEEWSTYFGERMNYHIRKAGLELASDKMWETLGKKSTEGLLKGMGFDSMAQFKQFVMTGKFPKGMTTPDSYGDDHRSPVTRHTGGLVDSSPGSRKGVARTQRGLHSSEVMVRAQKGEYVVDRKTTAENRELLDSLSSGRGGGTGGEPMGAASLLAGTFQNAMLRGFANSIGNLYRQKMKQASAMMGAFGSLKPGMYGDRYFGAEQLKNASIIASVGKKMGMSSRDIEIGIMTAITESGLVNVQYGDRDSLGLFQQRPSMGWGTPAQVTNPQYAAGKFFSVLKGIADRGNMAPWLAAQAVQRSAYSDGSNYHQYWDEAQSIFDAMVQAGAKSTGTSGGYVPGSGGWHKPSIPGRGWYNTHDYQNPVGSPLYAVSDGVIVDSRAITSGGSPGNGSIAPNGLPYRSYGETIAMRAANGDVLRYAHLQTGGRFVRVGQQVRGGSLIGRSGNTGNSTGAHTHFDVNGNYNASGWLAAHGVGLSKGAANIKWDNTIANLHHGEAVLTKDLNSKFHQGVENFANGGNNEYNFYITGDGLDEEEVANKVMAKIKRLESRKPGSRKR